jgi:hypothetical protein
MKNSIEMLVAFPTIKKNVNEARAINAVIGSQEFTQFSRACKLAKFVGLTVDELKRTAWNVVKEQNTGIEWKPFLEDLFSLTYSYIARLQRLAKIEPAVLDNYIQACRDAGKIPNILDAISFAENGAKDDDGENKPKNYKPLTISFRGKKASLNDKGTFTTTLTPDEMRALISLLQSKLV